MNEIRKMRHNVQLIFYKEPFFKHLFNLIVVYKVIYYSLLKA